MIAFLPSANGLLGSGMWYPSPSICLSFLIFNAYFVYMFSILLLISTKLRLFSALPFCTIRSIFFASFTIVTEVTLLREAKGLLTTANWGALSLGKPKLIECFASWNTARDYGDPEELWLRMWLEFVNWNGTAARLDTKLFCTRILSNILLNSICKK